MRIQRWGKGMKPKKQNYGQLLFSVLHVPLETKSPKAFPVQRAPSALRDSLLKGKLNPQLQLKQQRASRIS